MSDVMGLGDTRTIGEHLFSRERLRQSVESMVSSWRAMGGVVKQGPTVALLPTTSRHFDGRSASDLVMAPLRLPRREPTPRSDHRVVVAVLPNPKRPGSACHERYKLWRVGATVSELLAQGLRSEDVRWDSRQGFVVLRVPGQVLAP